MQFLSMVTGCVREATGTHITVLEFQGPTGPEILAPAGGFLASLERMFAPLTFPPVIIIIRKMFVPPSVCKKCLSPGDKQFVCPRGTNISQTQLGGGQTFFYYHDDDRECERSEHSFERSEEAPCRG